MSAPPEKTRLTAKDLAALCGVSERTVRYYVEEGLLPPPAARGRGPNFEDSHLTRLRLIRAMQQAGNDLDTIREYLRELEQELGERGATFEGVLAVWNGRTEQASWRERMRKAWFTPDVVNRYPIADGVELLVEPRCALPAARMQALLRLIREAFEQEA